MLNEHCGIDDWEIIVIDKGCNKLETKQKELFLAIKDRHICYAWSDF